MTTAQIINIVLVVLCAAVYGISMYFKTRGSATEAASSLIAEIEQSGLVGKEKMAYVVSHLYELIPAPFKTVFTEDRLRVLAQEVAALQIAFAVPAQNHVHRGDGKHVALKLVAVELILLDVLLLLIRLGHCQHPVHG